MTSIASGIYKLLAFKKQSGLGTVAGASGAQYLRRVASTLSLKKATYQSTEIKPSQQISDFRHGVRSAEGQISGEITVGTYQQFVESVCRKVSVSSISSGALTDVTAATTTGNAGTFTTVAANWMTLGFKVGMVGRWSGWSTTGSTNNTTNMVITALTATVMTVARLDGLAIGNKAAGDSVTFLEVGKHTYVPQSAQTRDYYTIEHWYSDIGQSEYFTDCVVTQVDVKLPPTGIATITTTIMGINMTTGSSQYFTTPNAVTTGRTLAAVNGVMYVAGNAVALITGLNFSIKGNHSKIGGVVGANTEPDIFPGKVTVDGQLTVLFIDNVFRDYFVNETEVSIFCVFTTNNTATADFMAISMPRCKVGSADKDDGEKGLVQTMSFVALENDQAGGPSNAALATTIMIQDSQYV